MQGSLAALQLFVNEITSLIIIKVFTHLAQCSMTRLEYLAVLGGRPDLAKV